MPRTDARSTSTCPTTTANDHNPSIPPIGGEGRLHDSAGPPIFSALAFLMGGHIGKVNANCSGCRGRAGMVQLVKTQAFQA